MSKVGDRRPFSIREIVDAAMPVIRAIARRESFISLRSR
jgi:hypothetical protein